MRLLYAADPFLPIPPSLYGGIERIVASLIRSAMEAGHEVAFLAHPDSQIPGAKLYPLVMGPNSDQGNTLRNARRVQLAVHDFRPDLLHSFARLALLLPVLGSALPKIMSYQREPTRWTVRWAARLAGSTLRFTGCSEWITRRGRACGGGWQSIPNGVDLERYEFQDHVAADAPLVFLSRIERVKGAHQAIATARAAGQKLILAGPRASFGPEANYWQREILPYLDRDGVSYVGALDDIQKNALLGRALALLVPIEWEEPFGLVFIEALACGTPVISCPRGALSEIVDSEREGSLCRDSNELIEAIGNVAKIDRQNCRKKVEACFSASLMWERYQRLYNHLASPKELVSREGESGRGRI